MLEAGTALGLAAQRSGKAFEILKKGLEPDYWRPWAEGYCLSNDKIPNAEMCKYFVKSCIQGMGASGLPKAKELVLKLKDRNEEFLREYSADIVQALFYLDWIGLHGLPDFRDGLASPLHGERWTEWKTGNRELVKWGTDHLPK